MEYSFSDYDSLSIYSNESGLEIPSTAALITPPTALTNNKQTISDTQVVVRRRNKTTLSTNNSANGSGDRNSTYRFSMANLEESHESELDAILGELNILEQRNAELRHGRTHSRTNSTISGATNSSISSSSDSATGTESVSSSNRESRTESPDNDSAFSDTVSLLSSESSASSGVISSHHKQMLAGANHHQQTISSKAAKIQLALQKLENPSIQRLFVKAFSADGASKSLLVDERMTCGHVTRLLADKNHVPMELHWALVEQFGELQMERLFEDHELMVENLMMWNPDSKNRVMFLQRFDKLSLFSAPEKILPGTQMAPGSEHDEQTRAMLIEEFFSTNSPIAFDGPLYLKSDSKKGWKRYHFVLRQSGIYYYPKEKTKSPRDLVCLTLLNGYNVYKGIGWKKKFKAPTDYTFALKSPTDPSPSKACRSLKMLCSDEPESLEKWVTAIRVAKYGKQLLDNHKILIEDLSREESDKFSANRSTSISSIVSSVPSQCSNITSMSVPLSVVSTSSSSSSNGRLSRASSSSSSGCLSDDNNGFDSEFTTGTIKRKPSMKPNLPLTSMTRQLKEVGETTVSDTIVTSPTSPDRNGTLTRRHSRRRSEESNNSGTLKRRQPANRGSVESMNSSNTSSATPTPSAPGTPTLSPLQQMPTLMTDSMFSLPPPPPPSDEVDCSALTGSTLSLDSLPPPPPPNELMNDFYGSQVSLVSLPPPPIDVDPIYISNTPAPVTEPITEHFKTMPIISEKMDKIPLPPMSKTMKPTIKAPPYKHPPPVNGGATPPPPPPNPKPKSVKFADSPVLLRRKVSFEDQVYANSPRRNIASAAPVAPVPQPPPRADATRLSSTNLTPPKRLTDSISNPPQNFLKDLQRVMRKKWQVAQKCKLEPATTPHEVLGFRDFNEEFGGDSHFYRETANVSNWVQEHYGSGADYALYENLGTENQGMEPQFMGQCALKKRPPPPPPKRSNSTHLTHRV